MGEEAPRRSGRTDRGLRAVILDGLLRAQWPAASNNAFERLGSAARPRQLNASVDSV